MNPKSKKKFLSSVCIVVMLAMVASVLLTGAISPAVAVAKSAVAASDVQSESNNVKKLEGYDWDLSAYYDPDVVMKADVADAAYDEISVIVMMNGQSLIDRYNSDASLSANQTVSQYVNSAEGQALMAQGKAQSAALKEQIRKSGLLCTFGEEYSVLFNGFEVVIGASDYSKLYKTVGDAATLVVGETYEKADASQVVENYVNIYEGTGIFNASDTGYDGSGTVIAVLDTGLDYTHSAFDPSRFTGEEVITLASLSQIIKDTTAATTTAGLLAEDVYVNKKVPYAYDYADKDSDVYPLNSEHGTHVSGIIVGSDDVITGVAPNAQLVSMKVFSDIVEGAKTSWLLAALEDCVTLHVDVINMSLGSDCGFAREVDDQRINEVYDSVRNAGISLIAAASNSYNATFGSKKNGNLGLTSNPDSSTVGSPSTYDAALSVASVSGTKTPYFLYNDQVIYFIEANDRSAKPREFVTEILNGEVSMTLDYVTVPGTGISADYGGLDVRGKVALVRRGITTFEEKVRIAQNKGAVGCIIYNNVSGDITMTIGSATLPTCSVSKDDGEMLASKAEGKISISSLQVAGPFMSDFSSWGPGNDLSIKPEITAHGGNIYSAVPGGAYDRLSGTSMAAPNQAGITALIRQYVKENFDGLTASEVTARVNQIMMSTTDVVYNSNGLPYAVRKQGAGLANVVKATTTPAYVTTFDKNGDVMDKTKLELGDDALRTGVYDLTFAVNNFKAASLTYDVGAIVMTEGVSETMTARGARTVTQRGYALAGTVTVLSVENGSASGNKVTVAGNQTAVVKAQIRLTDADKDYIDKSFANGMYVEGFVTLKAANGGVDLSVPYLAFYGDWTQAPIFDIDYYETDPDEKNGGIDEDDKKMADTYPTAPIGDLGDGYISYLGAYDFIQDPSATQVYATREKSSLSNHDGSIFALYGVWAGMIRAAKRLDVTITDTSTGEVIYSVEKYNQRKSNYRGGDVRPSSIDLDFDVASHNLKNNTKYSVLLQAYLDYERDGAETNLNNTFEFTFVTDFEAPAVTGCEFYSTYDVANKRTRYFANISIYDNHFSQAAALGCVNNRDGGGYSFTMFGKYLSALYSEYNSTYILNYELTDYMDAIKNSHNGKSFVVEVYDYARNVGMYEITIPNEVEQINFTDSKGETAESLTVSVNQVQKLYYNVLPTDSWADTITFTSSDEEVVGVAGGYMIARGAGTATITAQSSSDDSVVATLNVTVLGSGEPGFVRYDKTAAASFKLTRYHVDKAFYGHSTDERELGLEDQDVAFSAEVLRGTPLSFFPSETITVSSEIASYFPSDTEVVYTSSNSAVVKAETLEGGKGRITALAEGSATVTARVLLAGKNTYFSQVLYITVKNPYITSAIYLNFYKGLGGEVVIPGDLGITEIYSYAFCNYDFVVNPDYRTKEDSQYIQVARSEDTITKVTLPEGVKIIDSYAFANLTALEEVVLPSTLEKIQSNAFVNCTSLKKINFENVKFINQNAFNNCPLTQAKLDSIVAIGNGAFRNTKLQTVSLPQTAQSIGEGAFANNALLKTLTINAPIVKLGAGAFEGCTSLENVKVNANVIPDNVFEGCTALASVQLGADVSVIGAHAFRGTAVAAFAVNDANPYYIVDSNGKTLLSADGSTLLYVAPTATSVSNATVTKVGANAFSSAANLVRANLPAVTEVGDYAFAKCALRSSLTLGNLTQIGDHAFDGVAITSVALDANAQIGPYAFANSGLTSVVIPNGMNIADHAFYNCANLASVAIGDDVILGDYAFAAGGATTLAYLGQLNASYNVYQRTVAANSSLANLTIGRNVLIGAHCFENMIATTVSLGDNAVIGAYAFYNASNLATIDLSKVDGVGAYAFSGVAKDVVYGYADQETGEIVVVGLYGSNGTYAPALTSVDLTSATAIGEFAFARNTALTTVLLGDDIDYVPSGAFAYDTALESVNLEKIVEIGDAAFYRTALTNANLSSAVLIGESAFEETALTSVTLKTVSDDFDGVKIADFAFAYAEALANIDLQNAKYIGESAFEGTAITTANLTNAEYVGSYAFAASAIGSVVFGDKLLYVGENPFALCQLGEFVKDDSANFVLSQDIFVKDGVLYMTEAKGYVLVSYPTNKQDATYSVLDGTVRIGSYAFVANGSLVEVDFPLELAAIGHKAFFDCNSLAVVVFTSVEAPVLEEEYDTTYQLYTNLPQTGNTTLTDGRVVEGLAIVPYRMWNTDVSIFYYGATFGDYVGKKQGTTVMVAPSNGKHYDSFVLAQYFTQKIDGKVSPEWTTLAAIELINNLPASIRLSDETAVIAARTAYDSIATMEQKALVTVYSKLTNAENMIAFLKAQQGGDDPDPGKPDDPTPVDPEPQKGGSNVALLVIGLVALAIGLGLGAYGTVVLVKSKKNDAASNETENGETNE